MGYSDNTAYETIQAVSVNPVKGKLAEINIGPGSKSGIFTLTLEGNPSPYMVSGQAKFSVNGKNATLSELFAWIGNADTPFEVTLYPDIKRFGLVTQADFTRK